METPILDFVRKYENSGTVRLHMPGHKGKRVIGPEASDLTEIAGADELYRPEGIIRKSEENAAKLFSAAATFYSAEGSSLCIRAMLRLAAFSGRKVPNRKILAGRNVHRSFLSAAALLDLEPDWLYGDGSYLSCLPSPEMVEERLEKEQYAAVYLTSPDYLGNMADIPGIAAVCRRHRVPLLVDNAHGAYLHFLKSGSRHPLALGADMCCDSAHKTLPALTGAAYLHIGKNAPAAWMEDAKDSLALFGSTSPSYLILQSLDAVNACLAGDLPERLNRSVSRAAAWKEARQKEGWVFCGDEPLKLTFNAKAAGHTGQQLAQKLREFGVECEFADPDYCVLMPSAETGEEDWERLTAAFAEIPVGKPKDARPPATGEGRAVLSLREAVLSVSETVPTEEAAGRILADYYMGCPPAVPVRMPGEVLDEAAVEALRYYGVERVKAVTEGF